MRSEEKLLELISDIYEAAVDATMWLGVLERIGDAVGHAAVALVTTEDFDKAVDAWLVRHDPACLQARLQDYARPESNRALRAFMELDPLQVVSRRQFLTDREFEADPCFQAVHIAQGFYYSCISTLHRSGPLLSAFGVYRPRRFGDFESGEVEILQRLVPHLARALQIHRRLATEQIDRLRAEESLNLLNVAIWLVAGDGRIIFANRAAEDLLLRHDGLTSRNGKLAASHHADRGRLAAAIAGAADGTTSPRMATVLPLHRGLERRPLQVWAVPLPRKARCSVFQMPASEVMLLGADPERTSHAPGTVLKALYSLTDAEARLACGLLEGQQLEDYAEHAGVSMNTARTHLRSIFAKTDTNRQAELIRLLPRKLVSP